MGFFDQNLVVVYVEINQHGANIGLCCPSDLGWPCIGPRWFLASLPSMKLTIRCSLKLFEISNLSTTLTTDQKWSFGYLHISYQDYASCQKLGQILVDIVLQK